MLIKWNICNNNNMYYIIFLLEILEIQNIKWLHLSTWAPVNIIHPHIWLKGLQKQLTHRQMDDHIGSISDWCMQFFL